MLQTLLSVAKNVMLMPDEAGEVIHTAFEHEIWLTTPDGEVEIGGRANDWLAERKININYDYIFSWREIPGSRDHYRFAFILSSHAQKFREQFEAYLVSQNN